MSESQTTTEAVEVRQEQPLQSIDDSTEVNQQKAAISTMLDTIARYMSGEIQASAQDYVLLEKLNVAATGRYEEMADKAGSLLTLLHDLHKKQELIQPHLNQIDTIFETVKKLEQTMKALDTYTVELENQFKILYQ